MDTQLAIVIVIVALAVYYFVMRMYRAVKTGKCSCCSDASSSPTRSCVCGCGCGRQKSTNHAPIILEKKMIIRGMRCANCEDHVKTALENMPGVVSAQPNHNQGIAIVSLSCDISDASLTQTIEQAGYEVLDIMVHQAIKL
ncbi:MAG: heavy-metal-associated domain-containing protein [Desulfovibrionaceae bacterium]|nr:heavy-metal-associated domain-containing protein [Desulfovibrionaceae bacterium]